MPPSRVPKRGSGHLLNRWRDNQVELQPQFEKSLLLKEVAPISQNLSALGAAGLAALDYLDRGEAAPPAWVTAATGCGRAGQEGAGPAADHGGPVGREVDSGERRSGCTVLRRQNRSTLRSREVGVDTEELSYPEVDVSSDDFTTKPESWPALPLEAWQDTYATLHMWTQIVGKVRLALSPLVNHWWEVPLYVSARGLTTSAIPYRDGIFEVEFDFLNTTSSFRPARTKPTFHSLLPPASSKWSSIFFITTLSSGPARIRSKPFPSRRVRWPISTRNSWRRWPRSASK